MSDSVAGSGTYLDSASGEPLHPAARESIERSLGHAYADPRRLHGPARNARLLLDNARAVVGECLGVRPDEVTFTPSGTHAVHLGLLGLLEGRTRAGRTLLCGAVEHSAVLHAGAWHERRGGSVVSMPVDSLGRVGVATVREAVDRLAGQDRVPAVVAVQAANHEVGTVQPVAAIAAALDPMGVPVFVDACAAAGRLPLPAGWSVAAASAHKWGGPAGVGVLLVRKGARWRMPFPGDDRVDERATGFEDVAGALAAAAALQAVRGEREATSTRQRDLVDRIRAVAAGLPDTEVVGDPDDRLPHLVTFSCLYVDGEALVTELDRRGFGVASGSACTASTLEPSHVLAAMGALTHGNVRVSLSRGTTSAEVEAFLAVLPGVVAGIRARGRDAVSGGTQGSPGRTDGDRSPELELDCRGMPCPRPVIELARRVEQVAVGAVLRVVSDDVAAASDVPAWCRMRGHEYVGPARAADGVAAYDVRRLR